MYTHVFNCYLQLPKLNLRRSQWSTQPAFRLKLRLWTYRETNATLHFDCVPQPRWRCAYEYSNNDHHWDESVDSLCERVHSELEIVAVRCSPLNGAATPSGRDNASVGMHLWSGTFTFDAIMKGVPTAARRYLNEACLTEEKKDGWAHKCQMTQ